MYCQNNVKIVFFVSCSRPLMLGNLNFGKLICLSTLDCFGFIAEPLSLFELLLIPLFVSTTVIYICVCACVCYIILKLYDDCNAWRRQEFTQSN